MGLKKRMLSLVGRGQQSHDRYKRPQLVACGWARQTKKALGFFRRITWQASGLCEGEAVERLQNLNKQRTMRKYRVNANTLKSTHIMDAEQINAIGSKLTDLAARTLDLRGYL
jgi:hypothetical protein